MAKFQASKVVSKSTTYLKNCRIVVTSTKEYGKITKPEEITIYYKSLMRFHGSLKQLIVILDKHELTK